MRFDTILKTPCYFSLERQGKVFKNVSLTLKTTPLLSLNIKVTTFLKYQSGSTFNPKFGEFKKYYLKNYVFIDRPMHEEMLELLA